MHQQILANPGLVLLLLGIGVLAVCWELCSGLVAPGVAGVVCIVVALGSPAAKGFGARGVALVMLAAIFFALEAVVRSRGLLTLAGAASLLLGLRFCDPNLSWAIAAGAAILFSLLISFLFSVAFAARRSKLGILNRGDATHSWRSGTTKKN